MFDGECWADCETSKTDKSMRKIMEFKNVLCVCIIGDSTLVKRIWRLVLRNDNIAT